MSAASLRVITAAADLLDAQSPVVAAACRWVAADAAEKAARAAYDLANDALGSPERGPTMSNAVAAMRAAWTEQRAAAAELARVVTAYTEANP